MGRLKDKQTSGQVNKQTSRQEDERTDGWIDEMSGWTDRQAYKEMDRQKLFLNVCREVG
jgi:hypothetical protein